MAARQRAAVGPPRAAFLRGRRSLPRAARARTVASSSIVGARCARVSHRGARSSTPIRSTCCARCWPPPPARARVPLPSSAAPSATWATSSPSGSRRSLSAASTTSVSRTSALLFVDRLLFFDRAEDRFTVHALGFGEDAAAAARSRRGRGRRASPPARARRRGSRGGPRRDRRGGPASPSRSSTRAPTPRPSTSRSRRSRPATSIRSASPTAWSATSRAIPGRCTGALREENPAPFASYLELPEVVDREQLARALPAAVDRIAASRAGPIKGTAAARLPTPTKTRRTARGSQRSAKDRAENLMIVDLVRNDLGRVCETGSVEVPELMAIEAYASVFQMVSTVRGRLRADRDAVDLLRATFPPGSMTGAPKIAAMRILDRLEPVRRGIYSGALGYLDVRGGARSLRRDPHAPAPRRARVRARRRRHRRRLGSARRVARDARQGPRRCCAAPRTRCGEAS